jgi:hypothetical protein
MTVNRFWEIPGFQYYYINTEGTIIQVMSETLAVTVVPYNNSKKKCLAVQLVKQNGVSTTALVRRLVLLTFVGPCPKGCLAIHKDGNYLNCNLSNLEWSKGFPGKRWSSSYNFWLGHTRVQPVAPQDKG